MGNLQSIAIELLLNVGCWNWNVYSSFAPPSLSLYQTCAAAYATLYSLPDACFSVMTIAWLSNYGDWQDVTSTFDLPRLKRRLRHVAPTIYSFDVCKQHASLVL
jgi:hypothetical protein